MTNYQNLLSILIITISTHYHNLITFIHLNSKFILSLFFTFYFNHPKSNSTISLQLLIIIYLISFINSSTLYHETIIYQLYFTLFYFISFTFSMPLSTLSTHNYNSNLDYNISSYKHLLLYIIQISTTIPQNPNTSHLIIFTTTQNHLIISSILIVSILN